MFLPSCVRWGVVRVCGWSEGGDGGGATAWGPADRSSRRGQTAHDPRASCTMHWGSVCDACIEVLPYFFNR